jgi:hypothetical protein
MQAINRRCQPFAAVVRTLGQQTTTTEYTGINHAGSVLPCKIASLTHSNSFGSKKEIIQCSWTTGSSSSMQFGGLRQQAAAQRLCNEAAAAAGQTAWA